MAQTTEQRKMEVIRTMHESIAPNGILGPNMDRENVAARIRELLPVVRSAKWREAVEAYAKLVETEPPSHLDWAYGQGSVWFAYAVFN